MTAACSSGACDVKAVIQDFSGQRLGTGRFRYDDGVYILEVTADAVVGCSASGKSVKAGAKRSTTTKLVVAGYRPAGTASTSVRIQGERRIVTHPKQGTGCADQVATYLARGEATRFAAARPTPRPTPSPRATPKPRPRPKVATIQSSYFGAGVRVETYSVKGSTAADVSRSISRQGPYSDWLRGRAAGLTKSKTDYRFHFQSNGSGGCRIVVEAKPAIRITYTIVLPRWKAAASASVSTVEWWNDHLRGIAKHEKGHVKIYRAAAKKLNGVLASSTCANAQTRLNRAWASVRRQQCEFDMKEYGTASGLSLKACLAR